MPAKIDAAGRRQAVVNAAFVLVAEQGIDGLSLRKVAAKADLNIGSVRHFFAGHEDLMMAAAQDSCDRMARRLASRPPEELRGLTGAAALDGLQRLVEEVLPVDAARRAETSVVLEFVFASRTRSIFRPLAAQMAKDLRDVLTEALEALGIHNPVLAARQVAAMIGGLTLDALTPHGKITVDQLRVTLRAHLGTLLGEVRGP
jgi:AcrR family transcriptional regulator